MKKIIFYILFIFPIISFGQDIHFSQTIRAEHQINPALIGCFNGNIKAQMNWKDQWKGTSNTYRTFGTSLEYSFGKRGYRPPPVFFSVGAHVFKDVSGDVELGNTNVGATFSTLLKVNRTSRFVLGLQANYNSLGINPANMKWGSQYSGLNFDPSLSNNEGTEFVPFTYTDVSFGLAYWFQQKRTTFAQSTPKQGKIGFSAYHLNRPVYTFTYNQKSRLPIRFVAHADAVFKIHEALAILPNTNVMFQNNQHQILIGSLVKYNLKQNTVSTGFKKEWFISAGTNFRITNIFDAIIPQIYLGIEGFSLGLSYDINLSKISNPGGYRNGFEFSLRFINSDGYSHKNPFNPSVSF
jgi:type IX secretion system PorP/SprF family membrane protein